MLDQQESFNEEKSYNVWLLLKHNGHMDLLKELHAYVLQGKQAFLFVNIHANFYIFHIYLLYLLYFC